MMAAMVMLMMMIMMKVIMTVNDDNNLQKLMIMIYLQKLMIMICGLTSRNIQGQEHAMEPLERSNTLPVNQTLGFLLDWTN